MRWIGLVLLFVLPVSGEDLPTGAIVVDAGPDTVVKPLYCRITRDEKNGAAVVWNARLNARGVFVARNLPVGDYKVTLTSNDPGKGQLKPKQAGYTLEMWSGRVRVTEGKRVLCFFAAIPEHPVAGWWPTNELDRAVLRQRGMRITYMPDTPFRRIHFPGVPVGGYRLSLYVDTRAVFHGRVEVRVDGVVNMPQFERTSESGGVGVAFFDERGRRSPASAGLWKIRMREWGRIEDKPRLGHFFRATPGRHAVRGWMGDRAFVCGVRIRDQRVTRIEVRLAGEARYPLRVRFLDPEGKPCLGSVELSGFPLRMGDPRMEHRLELPAGEYTVNGFARGNKHAVRYNVAVGQGCPTEEITLQFKGK